MMKLNPAGNKKFLGNPEVSKIKATENLYDVRYYQYLSETQSVVAWMYRDETSFSSE